MAVHCARCYVHSDANPDAAGDLHPTAYCDLAPDGHCIANSHTDCNAHWNADMDAHELCNMDTKMHLHPSHRGLVRKTPRCIVRIDSWIQASSVGTTVPGSRALPL